MLKKDTNDPMTHTRVGKHDPSRNGYQKKYQKQRYHERMESAKKSLGGKCSKCGSRRDLELDHKDPDNKNFNISKLWSVPEDEFNKEVKKCRLLCNSCHRDNTSKQREEGTVKSIPGKSKYKNNRKKASFSVLADMTEKVSFKMAAELALRIAKEAASGYDVVSVKMASDFRKTDRIDFPVVTWTVFKAKTGHQLLFRVYGREKDTDILHGLLVGLKDSMSASDVALDYEDDLTEPGLIIKVLSGLVD